ncbi:hypothetical protein BJY52DRAFT_1224753 [Lactarius psammicola]|nr:hypothetical protein BJY52DRAFT_1224753 [Lactarius psammicola]
MHNGLPLSLLDFLLVTAMLLVTPSEEWMNVTRTSPSDSFPDDGNPSDVSLGLSSSNSLPSSGSLSSGTPDTSALLHTSEATPEIDRWWSSIPARVKDDNHSRYAESIDGPVSEASSRAMSRLLSHTDNHSTVQHSAYTSGQGVYAMHSVSESKNTRTITFTVFSRVLLYPWAAFDIITHVTDFLLSTQTSLTGRTTTTPSIACLFAYLPTGPTLPDKPGLCPFTLYYVTNFEHTLTYSSPASPDPRPASSTPSHPLPPRSRSYTHLRSVSSFTESQRDYNSPIKLPPNYSTSTQAPARGAVERGGVGRSLSIRTTNFSHGYGALSTRRASIRVAPSRSGLAPGDGDPFDLPPTYTAIDITPSPLRLGAVNGDPGIDEE